MTRKDVVAGGRQVRQCIGSKVMPVGDLGGREVEETGGTRLDMFTFRH